MIDKIKDGFHFTRRDRNGIIVLLVLIIIVSTLRILNVFDPGQQPFDFSEVEESFNQFKDSVLMQERIDSLARLAESKAFKKKYEYPHNPYPIPVLADVEKKEKPRESFKAIELNSADSIQLVKIPGIGKVLSKRIIKYREMLGGFYKPEQLKEVYGITNQLYENIKPQIQINAGLIEMIPVNSIDEYTLGRHPYISNYYAKAIIAFRKSNSGVIKNQEELSKNNILPDSTLAKISNYLLFN